MAGTEHYKNLVNCDLKEVPIELERVATAFTALGYERLQGEIDPDREMLRKLFVKVRKDCGEGEVLVAYYTGHGARGNDRFYLLTCESNTNDLSETALAAEDLARALIEGSKASQVLVLLDCCYAAAGADEVLAIANGLTNALGGLGPEIFVIAAAGTEQEAFPGVFSAALAHALTNENELAGGKVQDFLYIEDVMEVIQCYLCEKNPKQVARWQVNAKGRCRCFPNPRRRLEIRPGLDLETQRAFDEHWVTKARGAEVGVGGWYFIGREQAIRELVAWLGQAGSGGQARVVTGGPGAGKSAVLARIVTLSDPKYRKEVAWRASLDTAMLPAEGVVSVAVHARRKLLPEVVTQVAGALNLIALTPEELVDALADRPDKTVIVVDALDEADDKEQILSRFLRPLVGLSQIFLLIGTRPDSVEHGRRFRALGESAVEIDLDDPRYVGAEDVARYVERRLLATEEPGRPTPYREAPAIAHTVASAVAKQANNVFLVAYTAVVALLAKPAIIDVTEPGWSSRLPSGLDDAFSQFLDQLATRNPDGLSAAMTRAVLLPLAFAEGEGLPWPNVWAAIATAISGSAVCDEDIVLVRKHAAAFIVEALEADRSVYRLYHERISEYLCASVDARHTQECIVKALRVGVPPVPATQGRDWKRAHPYVLAHLASHALKAGVIGELAEDGMFITATEPSRTLQVLSKSLDPFARRAYASYTMAFQNLTLAPLEERLSYLEMAARQVGDDALAEIWIAQRHSHQWAVPWVRWLPVTPHRSIPGRPWSTVLSTPLSTPDGKAVIVWSGNDGMLQVLDLASGEPRGELFRGHGDWVTSVALGVLDGQPVIVSGSEDGAVRVSNMDSDEPRGKPFRVYGGRVTSVALGTLDGEPVIVSGSEDGAVRVSSLNSGTPRGKSLRGHVGGVTSLALGVQGRHQVIVSAGDDGTVRKWDLASRAPRGALLRDDTGHVDSVAVGVQAGKPVIVSGGNDGVRVWDLATMEPRGEPLRGHDGGVGSVALGVLGRQPVIVSGGADGTVRVWDLATMEPRGEPLRGHDGGVTSVALVELDGQPMIVSHGFFDGVVRVWDVCWGAGRGEPLRGHEGSVHSVALGVLARQPVIVSGGDDGTVRVWDLASGAPRGEPLRGHDRRVTSVVLGELDGQPVIVSGGDDGTVRVWDLASGVPRGEPLRGHKDKVCSVAFGELDGQPVIVSGSDDRTVRVWDLATRAPRGAPLRGHISGVRSVAVGVRAGQPVIVSGGFDGVRVWDLAKVAQHGKLMRGLLRVWSLVMGAPCGALLFDHVRSVDSVAVGVLDGQSVIVSGSSRDTTEVWDLASGAPLGEPLRGLGWSCSVALGALERSRVSHF